MPLEKSKPIVSKKFSVNTEVKKNGPKVRSYPQVTEPKKDPTSSYKNDIQQGALFMDEYETFEEGAESTCEGLASEEAIGDKEKAGANLQIRVSQSLHRKLQAKAEMEGVSIDEFAGELLAEGLVLRAWEIMERKSTMRSPNANQGNHNQSNNANNRPQNRYGSRSNANQNNGGGNYNRGRSANNSGHAGNHSNSQAGSNNRRANYNHIMEDSANFLEYVRSQEKKQR